MFWFHGRSFRLPTLPALAAVVASSLLAACSPSSESSESASTATPSLSPTSPSLSAVFRHVDPVQARSLLTQSNAVVILDVRTPREFSRGHLDGAINIDFNSSNFGTQLAALDRDATYLVHCAVGGRSTAALSEFRRLGFRSVIHLDGGIEAWRKANLPVAP